MVVYTTAITTLTTQKAMGKRTIKKNNNETTIKILHIEDEKDYREDMSFFLEREGFEVISASNAAEGYHKIVAEHPSLILCDLGLPDKSGMELLKQVKHSPNIPLHTPFMFLSGTDDSSTITESINLLADDYLVKPIPMSVLSAKIRTYVRKAQLLGKIIASTPSNEETHRQWPIIKKDLLTIINSANTIKHSFAKDNLHLQEIDKIVYRSLSVFWQLVHSEKSNALEQKPISGNDESIPLLKLIDTVTDYFKSQHALPQRIKTDFPKDVKRALLWVDHKYFAKAIEIWLQEIAEITPEDHTITISASLNYNHSLSISIHNGSLKLEKLESICNSSFLKTIFGLHGMRVEARLMYGKPSATLFIPPYRVWIEDETN